MAAKVFATNNNSKYRDSRQTPDFSFERRVEEYNYGEIPSDEESDVEECFVVDDVNEPSYEGHSRAIEDINESLTKQLFLRRHQDFSGDVCNASWNSNISSIQNIFEQYDRFSEQDDDSDEMVLDLNYQDNRSFSALHYACSNGDSVITSALLERGSRVNVQDKHGNTPLHHSAASGNAEVLISLIEHGADPNMQNFRGETALHLAAALTLDDMMMASDSDSTSVTVTATSTFGTPSSTTSSVESAAISIESNNNATATSATIGHQVGVTVTDSSKHPSEQIVEYLLAHGAAINQPCLEGQTPLHFAAASGNLPVVKLLLGHGAHCNVLDEEGDSPLHWAIRDGRINVIPLLLSSGANVDILNDDEESPLELAMCLGEQSIVNMLTPYSRNRNH